MTVQIEKTMAEISKLHHVTADEKSIFIASDSTVFCSESPISGSVDELLFMYKSVISRAKEHGAKIVFKYKTKSQIKSLSDVLPAALEEYNRHYHTLKLYWQQKLAQMPELSADRSFFEGDEHSMRVSHTHAMHYSRAQSTPIGKMKHLQSSLQYFLNCEMSKTTTIYL